MSAVEIDPPLPIPAFPASVGHNQTREDKPDKQPEQYSERGRDQKSKNHVHQGHGAGGGSGFNAGK
jgi:hypothetical protein